MSYTNTVCSISCLSAIPLPFPLSVTTTFSPSIPPLSPPTHHHCRSSHYRTLPTTATPLKPFQHNQHQHPAHLPRQASRISSPRLRMIPPNFLAGQWIDVRFASMLDYIVYDAVVEGQICECDTPIPIPPSPRTARSFIKASSPTAVRRITLDHFLAEITYSRQASGIR